MGLREGDCRNCGMTNEHQCREIGCGSFNYFHEDMDGYVEGLEKKLKAYQTLVDTSFYVVLNMNDRFVFACGDSGRFFEEDFKLAWPVIEKYGHAALDAYEGIMRKADPLKKYQTEDYHAAKAELLKLKEQDDEFMTGD